MKNSNKVLQTIAMALGNPVGYFGLPYIVCLLVLILAAKQVTGTLPILVFLGVVLISLVLSFLLMPICMPFAGKRILNAIEKDYGPKTRQHVFDVFAAAQTGAEINLDIPDIARAYREVKDR